MKVEECKITIEGSLPRAWGLTKAALCAAARVFARCSSRRIGVPFREVTIIVQDDASSAEVHAAINGVEGATDVITQGYDAMPGEEAGVYGELYVNADQATRVASHARGWSPAKEFLLYVAHGMDHLAGADDQDEKGYQQMRRRELRWLKKMTLMLALICGVPLVAEECDEWPCYVETVAQCVLPQGGGDMHARTGAAVRFGLPFSLAYACEVEVAALEKTCGLAWRNVWHMQGWETFGKLFGYERFDPFVSAGLRGWLTDGDVGPFIGFGALYYLDDTWALRLDTDVTLGLERSVETIHSVSLGLQYTF